MLSKTCCFTGHRVLPPDELPRLKAQLREEIIHLTARGYTYFGAGGALGFDTLAALTVLELKRELPQLRLVLILPCEAQCRGWPAKDWNTYKSILNRADKVVYISRIYDETCMARRNRHMVNNSSVCLCYVNSKTGGAAQTLGYAIRKNREIINLGSFSER